MSKGNYEFGKKLEMSANRLFAHLDELAVALESIKAQFPEAPIVEPREPDGSLTWVPLKQVPRNLVFKGPGWSMPQLRDQRVPLASRQDIRISFAAT